MTTEQTQPVWGHTQRQHSKLVAALSVAFVVGGLVLPLLPSSASAVPLCPFRALTGHSCPGCGMTRSCVAMLHGDLWTSLSFHPLGWIVSLGLIYAGLKASGQLLLDRPLGVARSARRARLERLVTLGFYAFVLLFGTVRLVLELVGILTPV
jgi:hypothetical protein